MMTVVEKNRTDSFYQLLFEDWAEAMLVLERNRIVSCNKAAQTLLQVDKKASLFRIHPARQSPLRQPDGETSKVKVEKMIALAYEKGQHCFGWIHRNAKGVDLPVEVRLRRVEHRGRTLLIARVMDLSRREQDHRQRQLRRLFFDNSSDAIVIADKHNRIVDVNAAFTGLTGYVRQQAIGQPTGFMKSGRHSRAFYRRMWANLKLHGAWEGEVWDRHKDGHVYPKNLKIAVVQSLHDEVSGYVGLFRDSGERRHQEQKLQELAFYDPLTKLANRRLLMERLEQRLIANDRNHTKTALLSIDVDDFKTINDTYGHPAGDALLVEIAQRMNSVVYSSDTLARIHGDDFIILREVSASLESLTLLANTLIAEVEKVIEVEDKKLFCSLSIGIAVYPDNASSASELISRADMATCQARLASGSHYCFYDQSIGDHHRLKLELVKGMKEALRGSEFTSYFQPVVRLSDLSVFSYEALARWVSPKRGHVSPDVFIPVAEESGLIQPISEQVIQRCCDLLLHPGFPEQATIALNLSAQQLKSRSLIEWLESLLESRQVKASQFKVELTESTLITDLEQVTRNLRRLKALGVDVALDDFGTGYSSLNHLKSFPLDFIKIDKSFVRDLTDNRSSDSYLIVKAIISMAQSLRLQVVAEGVETQVQVDVLRQLGCDLAQGFFFCRPKSGKDILETLI